MVIEHLISYPASVSGDVQLRIPLMSNDKLVPRECRILLIYLSTYDRVSLRVLRVTIHCSVRFSFMAAGLTTYACA